MEAMNVADPEAANQAATTKMAAADMPAVSNKDDVVGVGVGGVGGGISSA